LIRIRWFPDIDPSDREFGHHPGDLRKERKPSEAFAARYGGDFDLAMQFLKIHKELFALHLPTEFLRPSPLWDFDFRCTDQGECWIAVPFLTMGRFVLYRLP
jgi:hypothetical protein